MIGRTAMESAVLLPPCPRLAAWHPPGPEPRLEAGEVHLWKLVRNPGEPPGAEDLALLSADERARLEDLSNPAARAAFIYHRRAQRRILGAYLGRAAAGLRFTYGPHGKPSLQEAGPRLHFNLSHSGALGLLAVTRIGEIGIDLEQLAPRGQLLPIARRLLGMQVWQHLAALPPTAQQQVFYRHWTCLEARVKARGLGLFQANRDTDAQAAGLTFQGFLPHPGYQACLALLGTCPDPRQWRCFSYHTL